jgi:hypothetical protein
MYRYPIRVIRPQPPPVDWAKFWEFLQKASLILGLVVAIRSFSE